MFIDDMVACEENQSDYGDDRDCHGQQIIYFDEKKEQFVVCSRSVYEDRIKEEEIEEGETEKGTESEEVVENEDEEGVMVKPVIEKEEEVNVKIEIDDKDWVSVTPISQAMDHLEERLESNASKEREISHTPHGNLSWTGCYDDNCTIHMSDKMGARWFPRMPKSKPKRNAEQKPHSGKSGKDSVYW